MSCAGSLALSRRSRKLLDRVMFFAVNGTARQAKFAARLVAYSAQAEALTTSLAKVRSSFAS